MANFLGARYAWGGLGCGSKLAKLSFVPAATAKRELSQTGASLSQARASLFPLCRSATTPTMCRLGAGGARRSAPLPAPSTLHAADIRMEDEEQAQGGALFPDELLAMGFTCAAVPYAELEA